MTRDEVLARLCESRAEFDRLVAAIPADRRTVLVPDGAHSPRDIVFHIASYDDLIVRRLRHARDGELTAFDRDRDSWEAFNERIWAEAAEVSAKVAFSQASRIFLDLLEEVSHLRDDELSANVGVTAGLDPAWLQGRALAELIGIDGFEHYPMHYAGLAAAAASTDSQ